MTGAFRLGDQAHLDTFAETASVQSSSSGEGLLSLKIDRITYLADFIKEMETLARECNCQTLAGILALAHAEARQQIAGPTRP